MTKRFDGTVAIEALTLALADGEVVVLLGPTGAGKTTTLRLFAGLETPEAGRVSIGGTDVTRLPPAARDVAFVFQQYSLYPHYSVFDNLAFPLRAPGRRQSPAAIRRRVMEIADLLRIGPKLGNRATTLSGGEMQRVSIGRALVRQPALFLMDEPLSSLDATLREDLRIELKRIQRDRGATILYVTHDPLDAMTLADRIGILDNGRLIQTGPPRTVYRQPVSITAAQRLGSPPINLLPITLLPAGLVRTVPACDRATQAGVRPEDVQVGGTDGIEAAVLTVEPRGPDTVVLLDIAGHRLHALLDADTAIAAGEITRVTIRPEAPIWFDRTGRRVGAPAPDGSAV